MRPSFQKISLLAVVMSGLVGSAAHAAPITWFTPAQPSNGASGIPTIASYTSNLGVAFKTGPNSTYSLDWVNLELNTGNSTSGTATVKLALHDATNDIAYSAVAGATEYAVDALSLTFPTTINTTFDLNLDASLIPNVSNYLMSGNTAYTLILYNSSTSNLALRRTGGYAQNTTNNFYTVGEGFTALDTFRNNGANYTNALGSYPTLAISFGRTEPESVPEPPPLALAVSAIAGWWFVARRRGRAKSA